MNTSRRWVAPYVATLLAMLALFFVFFMLIAKLIPPRPLDLTLSDALGRSEKSQKEPDRVVKTDRRLGDASAPDRDDSSSMMNVMGSSEVPASIGL